MDIVNEVRDGVMRIQFNRPEKKNAITAAMYLAMAEALQAADKDLAVRVVLFLGAPEIFTAGNDLEDFLKNPPQGEDAPPFRFLRAISHVSKPVVAAVRGAAVGIGTTMLLHCDLVYAASNARFSMPFTQLGLVPEAAASLLLPRLAGYQRAAEKLLLGDPFDAAEALQIGLVAKVLAPDQLLEFAEAQVARLVALPAASLRVTKRLMKAESGAAVDERMAEEGAHFIEMLKEPAAKEAFQAFFERRKPDFSKLA